MTETIPALYALLLGLMVGSFLNVCISRWPLNLSVVTPRSRCPGCERPIRWYENIPIFSWLALRGKCRGCASAISPIYPAIELLVGGIWLSSVLVWGPTFLALRVAVFATILLGVAVTDLKHYLIPDGFTVFGFFWHLVAAGIAWSLGDGTLFAGPWEAVLGACVGAGAIAITGWLGEIAMKREAMGFGDVTLMAMAGAALGPGRTLLTIFVGALLGAVLFVGIVYPLGWLRSRRTGTEFAPPLVPFGVFLAPAALLTLLWGDDLIRWYRDSILLGM